MTRTTTDIDDEALAAAQKRLGSSTKVQTVNEALRRAAALPNQETTARAMMALLAKSEVDNPEIMEAAWQRVPDLQPPPA